MRKILFLAPYPNEKNSKDGMISRVRFIDNIFGKEKRNYLNVSLSKKSRVLKKDENIGVFNLNFFTGFLLIVRIILRSDFIYCHSLYAASYLWPFLLINRKGKLILDIHGVVPEEEKYFYNNSFRSLYFRLIECILFYRIDTAICVTKVMEREYRNRYNYAKCNFIVYGIMPVELIEQNFAMKDMDVNSEIIEIIYSGGVQKWQNIELMMNTIKKNIGKKNHYTILTGSVEKIKQIAIKLNIDDKYLCVTSCHSSELSNYYKKAHYAFILRDDSIVNRVANPTKLIEYLYYGITPIVLNPIIGDYYDLNYEYIQLDDFDPLVLPRIKNVKNREIALELIKNNNSLDLYHTLLQN